MNNEKIILGDKFYEYLSEKEEIELLNYLEEKE